MEEIWPVGLPVCADLSPHRKKNGPMWWCLEAGRGGGTSNIQGFGRVPQEAVVPLGDGSGEAEGHGVDLARGGRVPVQNVNSLHRYRHAV